jgi:AGZA family xanthine/uracil permease-like MFS transporter
LSGIIFLILSVTGARKAIAKALPDCLKKAIPAGIGLFIALLGFKAAGIVVADRYTMVGLLNLKVIGEGAVSWLSIAPAISAFLGLIVIAVLGKMNIKGNVIIGILASTLLYYLFTWTLPSFDMGQIGQTFVDFGTVGLPSIFKGESWVYAFTTIGVVNAICYIITFCLIDMFDTVGTLYGAASAANMLDENGDPINMDGCLMADSVATCAGAILGTSTVTTYVESAAGVGAGGRTGLTSLVVAACFVFCLFLSPVASVIPQSATAPALIYVGVLMLRNFSSIDMKDLSSAVPAFLTLILMPLTYSIANGIGIGAISYVLIKLCTGKFTSKDIIVTGIAIVFIVRFMLTFTGTYPVYVF